MSVAWARWRVLEIVEKVHNLISLGDRVKGVANALDRV